MDFKKGADLAQIREGLWTIHVDDFICAEVDSTSIFAVQALRMAFNKFHVEILLKGGNPQVFDGNRILAKDGVDFETTIKIFESVLQTGDTSRIPMSEFHDITSKAAKAHPEAARMR